MAREPRPPGRARLRTRRPFSSLTRQILAVNFIGLGLFAGGVLYLNQFRAGLIETRVLSLTTQAEIIAGAIAQTGARGPEATRVNPVIAAQILRRLVLPTRTRARLFNAQGTLAVDSRDLLFPQPVRVYPLPSPGMTDGLVERVAASIERSYARFLELFPTERRPLYRELEGNRASEYEEAMLALNGQSTSLVRENSRGESILSVAVPVQRFKVVLGGLMLTTEAGDIDQIVRAERRAIIEVFLVALGFAAIMSVITAGTIVRPIRRLANAAERVRAGKASRSAIPDLSARNDEVGDLSRALVEMTETLYDRIDTIEHFAADVAHEIKNPLTSIGSAVESLPLARDDASRDKLIAIVRSDVRRMDRLISDISEASRLDAQLSRLELEPVDLVPLLKTLVATMAQASENKVKFILNIAADTGKAARLPFVVRGNEGRIAQVLENLLQNAISFSPPGGRVRISVSPLGLHTQLVIEDEGVGIPDESLTAIFDRFYTHRPTEEVFGRHSGLGLSISKQIVEAYGGTIHAENRNDPPTEDFSATGARFVVSLRNFTSRADGR